jgi:DNA modification methylase
MRLLHGDCLQVLREIEDSSIDSVVTDPPYGLAFMGKKWDYDVPSVEIWAECLRVLKPGGHLLAFAGTRTQHRMAVRIEDAGFEIRDMIAWVYGSGFPKSLDISKAIDKTAGAEREVVGTKLGQPGYSAKSADEGNCYGDGLSNGEAKCLITAPATPEAQQWDGWGTALKPALEPITMARKPFKGTVAANVLQHGTGALNIDGCRVGDNANNPHTATGPAQPGGFAMQSSGLGSTVQGRWPANLIHDGSDEVEAVLGEAMRFFYCPKPSKAERGEGNAHPTVKPVGLMRYLCRLVTPPGGIVLDPFCGSGTTGVAAALEGFDFAGIERELEYLELARRRVDQHTQSSPDLSQ